MDKQSKDVLDNYLRPKLISLLAQCNDGQKRRFVKFYGEVETVDAENIPHAISIRERTIKNNIEQTLKGE